MTDGLDGVAEIIDRVAARRLVWMLARQREREEQGDDRNGEAPDDQVDCA